MGWRRLSSVCAVARTCREGCCCRVGVALGAHAGGALALPLFGGGVDVVELDALLALLGEVVDADDDALAALDLCLVAVGGVLDLGLHEALLDGGDGAPLLVDAIDQLVRPAARARW